ncbi:MAG: cytochrome c maturation protein CcmE [Actinobacteria bacterium]|nr:cytochrome c maturation protein CcmE [Actinomycetota bacterium]
MATRNPARLIVALAVAAVLAVFLLYTAVAGHSTPTYTPSQLAGHAGSLAVVGKVVGPVAGDSHSSTGLRFGMRNIDGKGHVVSIVYRGDNPPPLFKVGRDVVVSGTYANGRVSSSSLITKCPSKYQAAKTPS